MDKFQLGEWLVDSTSLSISQKHDARITAKLDNKVMQLLCYLAEHPDEVVSRNQLLDNVWQDQIVADDVLNVAISSLRKALGDDTKSPQYIKTIPRKGYQLIAKVSLVPNLSTQEKPYVNNRFTLSFIMATVVVALAFAWLFSPGSPEIDHSGSNASDSPPRQFASSEVTSSGANSLAPELTTKTSLAVLPFDYFASQSQHEYIADGLTEAIINRLVQENNLAVTSRTSVYEFKNKNTAIPQIGEQLKVDWILEGSVQLEDEQLQVTAQLIEAKTDKHIWSETFQHNKHDLFAMQTEISAQIAKRFNPQFESQDQSTNSVSGDAYSTYLKARYYHNKFELNEAEKLYQDALLQDQNFADAYAGIAQLYFLRAFSGKEKTKNYLKSANRYAIKAFQLDPNSAMTNLNLALNYFYFKRDLAQAKKPFELAFDKNNQDTMIQEWYITYLLVTQQFEKAKQLIKHMRQVSPLLYNKTSLYRTLYYSQDFDGALDEIEALSPYMNSKRWVSAASAWVYMADNDATKLSELAPQLLKQFNLSNTVTEAFQQKLLQGGIPLAIEYLLVAAEDKFTGYNKAELLAFAGKHNQALDILEKLETNNELEVFKIKVEPAFKSLHNEKRFKVLLTKLGL